MALHNHTGKAGEELGRQYLVQQGYDILQQNWRHSHWEVDVIAAKNNVLHFIEVKTRRSKNFGNPEDKVNQKKVANLVNAAEVYLFENPQWQRIQFDILSIVMGKNMPVEYFFIEDVAPW